MWGWAKTRRDLRAHTDGFTIVEIVVVIIVIGILVTIVSVGYAGFINNANDASVKGDLQKIDDSFKQFALDSHGKFPTTLSDLNSFGLQLSGGSYATNTKANVYVCKNANASEYAVVAMSKSGKRFVMKSERGVSEFTSSVVWATDTANWSSTCAAVDPTYGPIPSDVTGMMRGGWLAWTGVIDGAQYITNVMTNPSFESGALNGVGGYYSPTLSIDSSKAAYGSYSVKAVTSSSTNPEGFIFYGESVAGPNQTYTCSISLTGTAGKVMYIGGRIYDSSGTYITEGTGSKAVTLTSSWQRVSTTFTTPARTATVHFQARLNGADQASGISMWADGVMCAQTPTVFAYADGSSPGWIWNGSANSARSSGPGL